MRLWGVDGQHPESTPAHVLRALPFPQELMGRTASRAPLELSLGQLI